MPAPALTITVPAASDFPGGCSFHISRNSHAMYRLASLQFRLDILRHDSDLLHGGLELFRRTNELFGPVFVSTL
jgi:hypothetical protein